MKQLMCWGTRINGVWRFADGRQDVSDTMERCFIEDELAELRFKMKIDDIMAPIIRERKRKEDMKRFLSLISLN